MMKKRWITLLLAMLLALSVLGCGAPAGGGSSAQPAPAVPSSEPSSAGESEAPPAVHDPGDFRMAQKGSVRNEKFREQAEFAEFLAAAESCFLIPGLNESMTPQGLSCSEKTGLCYITSYASVETIPSAISAVDPATGEFVAEYYLYQEDGTPFTSHVGGVAVTEDRMYVSAKLDNDGSYSVAEIALADLPTTGSHDVTVTRTVPLPVSPSFLNYSEGMLWVGNFYHPKGNYNLSTGMKFTTENADGESYGCYILGFPLNSYGDGLMVPQGEKYPVPSVVLAAPDRIQGMVKVGETVYLSQSYGRTANSTILSYKVPDLAATELTLKVDGKDIPAHILDSRNQTAAITAMPMTEGLCIGPDGSVLVLFESGSTRYKDGKYRTDHVWKMKA